MKPEYESATFYDVVIRGERYQGWHCVYAGDGTLVFQNAAGEEKRFSGSRTPGWLKECWDAFVEMVAAAPAAPLNTAAPDVPAQTGTVEADAPHCKNAATPECSRRASTAPTFSNANVRSPSSTI